MPSRSKAFRLVRLRALKFGSTKLRQFSRAAALGKLLTSVQDEQLIWAMDREVRLLLEGVGTDSLPSAPRGGLAAGSQLTPPATCPTPSRTSLPPSPTRWALAAAVEAGEVGAVAVQEFLLQSFLLLLLLSLGWAYHGGRREFSRQVGVLGEHYWARRWQVQDPCHFPRFRRDTVSLFWGKLGPPPPSLRRPLR
jgi:hypothetical protein